MLFKNHLLYILFFLLIILSCKKDDEEQVPVANEYSEQVVNDNILLENFLKSHFYNYEDFESNLNSIVKIKIDSISGINQNKTSLYDQVKRKDISIIDANDLPVNHTLYYIIAKQGIKNNKPSIVDSVFVNYEGKLLNGFVFDQRSQPVWFDLSNNFDSTEFLGYNTLESEAKVLAIIVNGRTVDKIYEGNLAELIFNQSPFYAESGGQVGDTGLVIGKDIEFIVNDTKKKMNNYHAHEGIMQKGSIRKNDILNLTINKDNRTSISLNHSSTHLLHEALRRVLGDHVTQKGSQINAKKFRFDFSHNNPIEHNDLLKIESIVNEQINKDSEVLTEILTYDEAIEKGALALFGEKYDDIVRMCIMGENNFSIELCGGTHVKNLGEIGSFKLTSQSSVASGVRRLEAVTGLMVDKSEALIEKILNQKKAKEDKKSNKKSVKTISKNVLNGEILKLGEVSLFFDLVKNIDGRNLRLLIDECKKDYNNSVICIISANVNKVTVAMGVTDDLIDDYDSVELVNIVSEVMKGKGGGGRRDMALAGGTDINMVEEAKKILIKKIENKN